MNNPEFFESINKIEMRVYRAEYQIQSARNVENLFINLSLITIARGSCSMIISPGKPKMGNCGKLHIPLDRNVIEAALALPQKQYEQLIRRIVQSSDRAVTAKMTLDKTLVLDYQGCLIIDDATDALITDLVWTFPLK